MAKAPFAALRIRRRRISLFPFFRIARIGIGVVLVGTVSLGAIRYVRQTSSALALQFTQHIVGQATGAVGVLGVAIGDMQSDGRNDIVTAGKDGVKVYIQQENKTFEQKIVDDVRGERVILKDFNKDGSLDILVTVDANPSVKLYLNQGDTEFSKTWIGSGSKAAIAVGDIDADGAVDIVTSLEQAGEYVLQRWMNDGSGIFNSTTLASNTGVTALAIADIDGNGYPDIITGGSAGLQGWDTTDGVVWSREDINTSQTSFTTLAVGDVNGDDGVDIVVGDQKDDTVTYYRHIEYSTYQKIALADSADAITIQIVDLNEDGFVDILATSQDEDSVYWFKNDGQDTFTRSAIATNLQSVFAVAASDVDADNDFDFVVGDHFRGTVYWYERTHAKPVATTPTDIAQMTDGSGRVVFTTEVSQQDSARTRVRAQYSPDGEHWYKAYLSRVSANKGKVDVNHDNPYQIGTVNPIDTDLYESVKLTVTWDTKSIQNLGGPIVGDVSSVQLRLIPRDSVGNGDSVATEEFRVDNKQPVVSGTVGVTSAQDGQATLTWDVPSDGALKSYRLYYGTDATMVSDQISEEWKSSNDAALADRNTTTTTINGLTSSVVYAFKLIARDAFGNESAWPVVSDVISSEVIVTPTPSATPTTSKTPEVTETPIATESVIPTVTPVVATPTPVPALPSTTFDNRPPIADAGASFTVNPSAVVILDGNASVDPDGGLITYVWKQISGETIDLLSSRTANPSFSSKTTGGPYIFMLTVKDERGASSTDLITVAVENLPAASLAPVAIVSASPAPLSPSDTASKSLLVTIARPANNILFIVALILTVLSLVERIVYLLQGGGSQGSTFVPELNASHGRVVHYRTGAPIAGVQIMMYDASGKLRSTDRTNEKGEFSSLFPVGEYTIGVHAPGFIFSGVASHLANITRGLMYTGGKITVTDATKPLDISIPMKPSRAEVGSWAARFLPAWQAVQNLSRILSWPVFIAGAAINTGLVFLSPGFVLLAVEVMYIVLIIIKVVLEMRVRPAYGFVRDAITHMPLDLAVVRLFDQKTNRLIMTRVANSQGKFFALPPSGTYMITVTKPGYAPFTRDNVTIESAEDSVLQMTADLMPAAPQAVFAGLKAGVI